MNNSKEDSFRVSNINSSQTKIRITRSSVSENLPSPPKPVKRKSISSCNLGEIKKFKMDEQILKNLLAEQTESFSKQLGNVDSSIKQLADRFDPIEKKLESVDRKFSTMEEGNKARDEKLACLEENVANLRESIKKEVKDEISKELESVGLHAHKAFLMREIEKTSSNIIIYGLKTENARDDVEKLLRAKLPNSSSDIKNVVTLGKEKSGKFPPILVTLSNEFCRNNLLKNLGSLEGGIIIERDIPACYRDRYKQFKRKAWSLKQFMNVTPQIIFQAHILTLRYKEPNKGYIIHEEYFPKPDDLIKKVTASKNSPSLPPSSAVSKDSIIKAEKTLLMLGVKGESEGSIREILGMVLPDSKLKLIEQIDLSDNKAKLVCKSPASAKSVFEGANGKQSGEVKINLALF